MKRVIILEKENNPNEVVFKYLLWVDVPSARQSFYVNANIVSSFKDISGVELDALKNGSICELSEKAVFSKTDTVNNIKTFLIGKYNEAQTRINNLNEWVYYGTFWDGSAWTNLGVA